MKIEFILASGSPRRKSLLNDAGLEFKVIVPEIIEKVLPNELPEAYVNRNSDEKAQAILTKYKSINKQPILILAADTIVVLAGEILEKPESENDAMGMLSKLSASTHQVLTGYSVVLSSGGQVVQRHFIERTNVTFKSLSDLEIKRYVETGEPMDKAGAYAAQGVGAYMIESIDGSYTNVIGLPISQVFSNIEVVLNQIDGVSYEQLPFLYSQK